MLSQRFGSCNEMIPVKVCLFDLGNVIAFFSHKQMCLQLSTVYKVDLGEMREFIFKPDIAHSWEKGECNQEDVYEMLCEKFNRHPGIESVRKAACEIFRPNEEIIPLITQLKQKGCRLILLSNTCDAHFTYLQSKLGILELFNEYILSYEVGHRKPEHEIFELAIEKAGVEPGEIFLYRRYL